MPPLTLAQDRNFDEPPLARGVKRRESKSPSRATCRRLKKRRKIVEFVRPGQLVYPRSLYDGWEPPLPEISEEEAVKMLDQGMSTHSDRKGEGHTIFALDDFTIYRPSSVRLYPNELTPLHYLNVQMVDELCFDRILSAGSQKYYIQNIPLQCVIVEGYGDSNVSSVRGKLCIRSKHNENRNIWYCLGEPATEYERYHKSYIWIAELGKHFIDFLTDVDDVTLRDFTSHFHAWLQERYGPEPDIKEWLALYGSIDFRAAVVANVAYLWKEAYRVAHELCYSRERIWGEVDPKQLSAINDGTQKLDILWLYSPSDTTLGHGRYNLRNELFMSDNCGCGREAIGSEEVVDKVQVDLFATDSAQSAERNRFIVRQTFRTEPDLGAYDFRSLKKTDLKCKCHEQPEVDDMEGYGIGDTLLIWRGCFESGSSERKEVLEPAVLIAREIKVEVLLLRLSRADRPKGRMNELLITNEEYIAAAKNVIRKCKVARFDNDDSVCYPFTSNGAGDLYFVIKKAGDAEQQGRRIINFYNHRLVHRGPKMRGMGLFCGGGNFDRGFEDGGAVDMKYGVDWNQHALHSYRAILANPDDVQLFRGSVDDYLSQAIRGSSEDIIAKVGEVDFIPAGCPCPGFSTMQIDKMSDQSKKNPSLTASVVSYVDFYMPTYLILENVPGLAVTLGGDEGQSVFSQIHCTLVAMGYQCQQCLMDAYTTGSCQSRTRIFIIASAPGVTPLKRPPHSHGSPWSSAFRSKKLGKASNGLPFGKRMNVVAPLPFTTIADATRDLPWVGDSHSNTCIRVPDHRVSIGFNKVKKGIVDQVPAFPTGTTFVQAALANKTASLQLDAYSWRNKNLASIKSKAWSKVYPDHTVD